MSQNIRQTFEDGSWWEFRPQQPFGLERALHAIMAPAFRLNGVSDGSAVTVDHTKLTVDILDQVNMAMLLHCTTAWSWDMEVTQASIEGLPAETVNRVLRAMNDQYHPVGDKEQAQKKGSS